MFNWESICHQISKGLLVVVCLRIFIRRNHTCREQQRNNKVCWQILPLGTVLTTLFCRWHKSVALPSINQNKELHELI